jgi:DNA helicase-2/ATP-dependent DNA helicase PcrA
MGSFGSSYSTPGWQRAQARKGKGGFDETGRARGPGGFSENGARYGKTGRRGDPDGDTPDGVFDQRSDYDEDATSSPPPGGGRSAREARREGVNARAPKRAPLTIEGELIAKSTGAVSSYAVGDRVFHLKFGNGNVTAVDGNKLTIRFDKAGEKRVVDSFVERV